ncbi:MAG TPA: transglycosylase domain-containing protein [Candidatus Binataceae bacterium]
MTNGQRGGGKKGKARWRGTRPRVIVAIVLLFIPFVAGFYLAQVYEEISTLIGQRRAAMTSAIFAAPAEIRPGDDIERLGLIDRLDRLSYTAKPEASSPGEYVKSKNGLAIYVRSFRAGVTDHPAAMVRVGLAGARITGVADAYGAPLRNAMLEPEVIGRLLPGAPPERVDVQLAELKPFLVRGLLATEDRYFYYHPGIDPVRIVEAAIADLRSRRLSQGASTITQQLARTFMEQHAKKFSRKFRELAVAFVLELRLKKNEILERYINDVPMGEYGGTPISGLPQAARYLFNKDLGEVTPAEAATLIGMIQAPTAYDPRRHPELSRQRRDTVLAVMLHADAIDKPTYDAAVASPITLTKPLGLRRAPYFTDYVTGLVQKIPGFNGNLEGLKVYTTLDSQIQSDAAASVLANLERLEKDHKRLRRTNPNQKLQSSMVVLDVETGAIRAMVGGRNYSESQFNRAAMALRQPGSAFKPIVYLTALDPERATFAPPLTLASVLPDEPMSFNGWTPANYERTYQPQVSVVEALYESLNVPTAWVGNQLGPGAIVKTAHELGINEDLPAVLPISIGADETTLLELTGAYQVFASEGMKAPPYPIESVVDGKGHLIYQHQDLSERMIRPAVAYLITGALKAVIKYGTGASAGRMGIDFPAAGKTGTTQDYKDGYFIGYTPEIVCGVWVGFDEPQSLGMPGAEAALPAWVSLMNDSAPDDPQDFPEPSGITMASIDPASGGLATQYCPRQIELPFLLGTQPTQLCQLHGGGLLAAAPAAVTPGAMAPGATMGAPPAVAMTPPASPSSTSSPSVFGGVASFFGKLFSRPPPTPTP